MTAEETNRKVAKALGWDYGIDRVIVDMVEGQWVYADGNPFGPEGYGVDFSRDPAAADLVKSHMRAKGWRYCSGWGACGAHAHVDAGGSNWLASETIQDGTEERALCLAFLAACKASKEVE